MYKIFITTGGTGGHIIPARCLAQELCKKHKTYILADKNYKNYVENEDNFKFYKIYSSQFQKKPLTFLKFSAKVIIGFIYSFFLILIHRPKFIFAFGGYATFPVLIAAILTKRKIILHEQNAHLGKVHRIFAKYAYKIALTFEKTDGILQNLESKTIITGNPVRKEILELNKKSYNLPQEKILKEADKQGYENIILAKEFDEMKDFEERENEKFNILVLGGSGGAKIFSEILPQAFFNLSEKIKNNLNIFQQCRADFFEKTVLQYEKFNINIEIKSFFYDIKDKIDKSHLIIARSGSSSLAEFAVAKKPMILIPFANSADNHQLKNALIFQEKNSAIMIEEKDFTIQNIVKILTDLLQNQEKLIKMSKNCEKIAILDATKKLANIIND